MLHDTEILDESALLIDLENIRLSWEKCYHKLFRYTDLCWLCLLLERRFQVNVKRIVVFMSHPEECKGSIGDDQLEEMRLMYYYLQEDQKRSQEKVQKKKEHNTSVNVEPCVENKKEHEGELEPQYCDAKKSHYDDSSLSNNRFSVCTSQQNPLVVNLCSDDDKEEEGMCLLNGTNEYFFGNKKSQLTSSDSDTISSHISILEEQSDGLFKDAVPLTRFSDEKVSTQPLKALPTVAPIVQRSISCNDEDDEVEWVMSVDSQSITSFNNEEKENDEGLVSHSNTLSSPHKECLEETSSFNLESEKNEPFTRLGVDTCPECEVVVKTFGYKMSGRRRVQRCCDVAIGTEVTKICFMARYSSIFLFSADSDFEDTAKSCVETENLEGVIKYAKPIRILGFSFAFESSIAFEARKNFLERRALRHQHEKKNVSSHRFKKAYNLHPQFNTGISVFFIDYEFPVIRRVLSRSNRPMLNSHTTRPSTHVSDTVLNQRSNVQFHDTITHTKKGFSNKRKTMLETSQLSMDPSDNSCSTLHSPCLKRNDSVPKNNTGVSESFHSYDTHVSSSDSTLNLSFKNKTSFPSHSVQTSNPSTLSSKKTDVLTNGLLLHRTQPILPLLPYSVQDSKDQSTHTSLKPVMTLVTPMCSSTCSQPIGNSSSQCLTRSSCTINETPLIGKISTNSSWYKNRLKKMEKKKKYPFNQLLTQPLPCATTHVNSSVLKTTLGCNTSFNHFYKHPLHSKQKTYMSLENNLDSLCLSEISSEEDDSVELSDFSEPSRPVVSHHEHYVVKPMLFEKNVKRLASTSLKKFSIKVSQRQKTATHSCKQSFKCASHHPSLRQDTSVPTYQCYLLHPSSNHVESFNRKALQYTT